MDLAVLKKKLSTFRSGKSGRIMNVSDELLYEILLAWEEWTGPSSGFYAAIGADHRKMASLIGRAKKLKREGVFPDSNFKEVKLEGVEDSSSEDDPRSAPITMKWERGRIIRFSQVSQLVEFLNIMESKKAA